ncbi:TPA: pheST operon leader peptide PheM [Citrobacter freundii]|nr:pheST operon leader peptide PheM [Citrobacter freundii]HAT3958705.1 pheST operon leader peptide PheM [Citrobacter freundii]HAT3966033.1 pheST operon leader peptide PheM [Citrobacter freundii]
MQYNQLVDNLSVSLFNKGCPVFTTQGNASMNAAILRFFFYFST